MFVEEVEFPGLVVGYGVTRRSVSELTGFLRLANYYQQLGHL